MDYQLYSIKGELITKQTAVFCRDDDGHDYCIHEDDEDIFYELLEKAMDEDYNGPNFDEFEKLFSGNAIGMDPNYFRKKYLK